MRMTYHPHHKPQISPELHMFNYLQARMNISKSDRQHHINLLKGYEGELEFFNFLEIYSSPSFIPLYSFNLSCNNSNFQIDSLLISQNTIYLFEVKNYEGDFYIQGKNWFVAATRKEINNPLIQLVRSESLLRQLIQQLGFNFEIKSYVVFVNPEFALFQAPFNLPIILPAQMNRFFKKMDQIPFTKTASHRKLAKQLMEKHNGNLFYDHLPKYSYEQLKKGIVCTSCSKFMTLHNRKNFICNTCGYIEKIEFAVIRNVREFSFLFPNKKITTHAICDWISATVSRKTVWRILSKYFKQVNRGKVTYYE